jgi:cysteine/O-acetylserine efflux protein
MFSLPALITFAIVGAFTPGPNTLSSMYTAAHYERRIVARFLCGSLLGYGTLFALSGLINVALAAVIPTAATVLRFIGAGYLLYLAFVIVRSGGGLLEKTGTRRVGLITGLTLQLVNPKGWLYGITGFSTFVAPFFRTVPMVLLFVLFFTGVTLLASLSWAVFGASLKSVYVRYARPFNLILAASLVYCAAIVLFE